MNTKIFFLPFITAFLFSGVLSGQDNYRTLVFEGNQKFGKKDYDGATALYLEAIKKNNKDFTAHYNLGNALYKSKKYQEAKAEYEKAEQLSQTLADKSAALHNLGNAYMQLQKPDKAAESYKQSLKQNPYSEATRKNYEIAKLTEKQNQQKNSSGKGGGGKDQQQNDQKGGPKDQKDQGQGQQNQGKGQGNNPDKKSENEGKIPKGLENQILNKVSDKERETARRILNKNSYSMPESNEKDW